MAFLLEGPRCVKPLYAILRGAALAFVTSF
jgi:hypothetical protein